MHPDDQPQWQRQHLLVSTWSQFVSHPEQQSFATTTTWSAAFPTPAIQLATAFSELGRLNLAMYGVVLAGAPENRENLALSKTTGPFAWSQAGMLPSLAVPFSAYTVALIDLTLQTSVTLNRLAFDGYAGMVRHALAAITAMGSGARIADVRTKAASEVPERSSSIATEAPVAVLDIARKVADSAPAAALPASRRQRSRSPRSRASS